MKRVEQGWDSPDGLCITQELHTCSHRRDRTGMEQEVSTDRDGAGDPCGRDFLGCHGNKALHLSSTQPARPGQRQEAGQDSDHGRAGPVASKTQKTWIRG